MDEHNNENKVASSLPKVLAFIFMVILVLVGAWLLIYKTNVFKLSQNQNSEQASDIREIFTVDGNNSIATPTSIASVTPSGQNPTPTPATQTTPSPSVTPSPTPTPENQIYTNDSLGFSIELPYTLQAVDSGDGKTIGIVGSSGSVGNIQVYAQSNETLELIKTQLEGSSSTSNVRMTTFLGQSALSFRTNNSNQQGIALIYNQKIYYVMAQSFTEPPFSSFKFE